MFCSKGGTSEESIGTTRPYSWESKFGLLGHDLRKEMFDQTSENICFVLPIWMQPAWPGLQNGDPFANIGNADMGKANLGDCIFPI